jgi:hypothetical protein
MNENDTCRLTIAGVTLTRVGYVDVGVPPEGVGLGTVDFATLDWAQPRWVDGGQVRIGAATWFADAGGIRCAFDPLLAADSVLRADRAAESGHQEAVAAKLAEAGFTRESVDCLLLTHIEGVGMTGWRDDHGRWSRFFPNARILVSDVALGAFRAAPTRTGDAEWEAWTALLDGGHVGTFDDGAAIAPGLTAELTGGNCPGHAVFHFGEAGCPPAASLIGHLAVSPIHLTSGACAALHEDPAEAWSRLHAIADDGRALIGPLWPTPGCGCWRNGRLEPGE